MFEKLREYGLYIIIGIISLAVLGLYFISNIDSKKGVKYYDDIQGGFLNATAIEASSKTEIKGTINDYIKLSNKSFGSYNVNTDFGTIVLNGADAEAVITEGKLRIASTCSYLKKLYDDETEKQKIIKDRNLIQIIIPTYENANDLLGDTESKNETYIIKGNKIITCNGKEYDVKGRLPVERGFFHSALFGLGFFGSNDEAIKFKEKYFSGNGIVITGDTTPFVVFDVNGAVEAITRDSEGGRNNNGNGRGGNGGGDENDEIDYITDEEVTCNIPDEIEYEGKMYKLEKKGKFEITNQNRGTEEDYKKRGKHKMQFSEIEGTFDLECKGNGKIKVKTVGELEEKKYICNVPRNVEFEGRNHERQDYQYNRGEKMSGGNIKLRYDSRTDEDRGNKYVTAYIYFSCKEGGKYEILKKEKDSIYCSRGSSGYKNDRWTSPRDKYGCATSGWSGG